MVGWGLRRDGHFILGSRMDCLLGLAKTFEGADPLLAGVVVAALDGVWWGIAGVALAAAGLAAAIVAWRAPEDRQLPRIVTTPAYVVWGLVAGLHAWINALRGELNPVWEPTRRS